jgi:hypothetical protein
LELGANRGGVILDRFFDEVKESLDIREETVQVGRHPLAALNVGARVDLAEGLA